MLPEQAIKDKSKLFIECFLARCIFTTKSVVYLIYQREY